MATSDPGAAERKAARLKLRVQRRMKFYGDAMEAAATGRERLEHACRYLRAVGDDLDDATRTALAVAVTKIADERNEP